MANYIMEDGFPTRVRFLGNQSIANGGDTAGSLPPLTQLPEEFNAVNITPPAYDLGGENDVTSMENNTYRTKAAKRLVDVTTITMEGFYSPELYKSGPGGIPFFDMIGKNQYIEIIFPPEGVGEGPAAPNAAVGRSCYFWGFIDKFTPGSHEEGSPPTATIEIVITNRNLDGDEVSPVVDNRS